MVRCQGREVAWWNLEGDAKVDSVATSLGMVHIEHGDGGVRIVEAPCRNRLCIRQGWVRHANDRLVCLPSSLVISIEGASGTDEFDALH